ncbi:class I SAM-dependent methyltransferase [Lunatimonas salinarum]|uniref:class I SAM-dependent methyltransferase n=1 Tax=Lunatimonas salinarum TaxID=1774590 RepID=UPI001ADEEBED|nr:class I SAM-dependent methyltransferase [Lunatimonas salinarum]
MEKINKSHWENVYQTKDTTQVGWFQGTPKVSIDLISGTKISGTTSVIDVGGGDGALVDWLLEEGFEKITVLDISASALEKSKIRLGEPSSKVLWEACDILDFEPKKKFDLWHDRAVFHFLTNPKDQQIYRRLVECSIHSGGFLLVMTFSKSGPTTCSGLTVQQYDIQDLEEFFVQEFELIQSLNYDHITPSGTAQNYSVALFRRK